MLVTVSLTSCLLVAWICSAQLSSVHALLQALAAHVRLHPLWSHTHGAVTVIGSIDSTTDVHETNVSWLRLESSSTWPALHVPRASAPADTRCHLILFDAPDHERFYTTEQTLSRRSAHVLKSTYGEAGSFRVADEAEDAECDTQGEARSDTADGSELQPHTDVGASPPHVTSSFPSALEILLRRVNACRTVSALVHHFISAWETLGSRPLIIDDEFDFLTCISPLSCSARLASRFSIALAPLLALLFSLCSALLRMLDAPSFSLTQLVTTFFSPREGERRNGLWHHQPIWRGSHALTILREKMLLPLRVHHLNARIEAHTQHRLGVQSVRLARLREARDAALWSHILDVLLGIACAVAILYALGIGVDSFFFESSEDAPRADPSRFLAAFTTWTRNLLAPPAAALDHLLSSSAPAGLKLNPRLHGALGRVARQIAAEQIAAASWILDRLRELPLSPSQLRTALRLLAALVSTLGARFALACVRDVVWCAGAPVRLVSLGWTRVYGGALRALSSLVLLFRGRKRNVLRRGREDTFRGADFEHVLLGTLALATIILLAPTLLVWRLLAAAAAAVVCHTPEMVLWLAACIIEHAPLVLLLRRVRDACTPRTSGGRLLPAGVWFEVMPPQAQVPSASPGEDNLVPAHMTYLLLRATDTPLPALFFRYRTCFADALHRHPPKAALERLLFGNASHARN